MNKRNTYTSEFKAEVVLEVLREDKTINQIAADRGLNPVIISQWKAEFLKKASMVFGKDIDDAEKQRKEFEAKQDQYEKKIGQLTIEVDWLKKKIWSQIILSRFEKRCWKRVVACRSNVRRTYLR